MKILWYKMDGQYNVLEERILIGPTIRWTAKHLSHSLKCQTDSSNTIVIDGEFRWYFTILEK